MSADFVPGDFAAVHNDTAKCFNGTRICCAVSRSNGSVPRNRAAVDGQRRALLHIDAAAAHAPVAGDGAAVHGHGTAGAQDHTAAGSGGVVVFLNGNIPHGEAAAAVHHHRAGGRAGELAAVHHHRAGGRTGELAADHTVLHGQAGRGRVSRGFLSFHRFRRGLPNGEDGAGVGKDGVSLKVQHGGDPRRDGYVLRVVLQKQNGGVRGCSGLDGIKRTLEGRIYRLPDLGHGIGNTLEGIGLHTVFFRMAAGGNGLFQILMVNFIVPDSARFFPGHTLRRRNGGSSRAIIIIQWLRNIDVVALLVGPVVLDDTAGDGEMAVKIVHRILITAFDSTGHPHTAAIVNAIVACDLTAADGNIRSINAAHIAGNHTAGDFHDAALDADTAVIPDFAAADNHGSFPLIGPIEAGAVIIDAAAAVAADRTAGHDNL